MQKLDSYFQFIREIKLAFFRKKWRNLNKYNSTSAGTIFDINKVNVGQYTYGTLNIKEFAKMGGNLKIGSFCSIAPNVTFLLSGEHDYKNITTFPIESQFFNEHKSSYNGDITIEDDVWIGYGSIILSGVTVGQGAIIGAGTVVAKDIPPYAIYAGNRIIKYRFERNIIEKLLKISFKDITKENIKNYKNIFLNHINDENIDEYIYKLPRKENDEKEYN